MQVSAVNGQNLAGERPWLVANENRELYTACDAKQKKALRKREDLLRERRHR